MTEEASYPTLDNSKLVEELAKACDAVGGVEKKGRNETQNYKYQRAADVAMAIRHELFGRGIVILPDEQQAEHIVIENTNRDGKTTKQTETRLRIDYHILGHGGEIVMQAHGVARDSGDKAIWKAKTGALKYFLRGLGLIPDEQEPEYDGLKGTAQDEEIDERVEIAGLIAQETESESSRWILVVDREKKQWPVKMDTRSVLSKKLLVGYNAVLKGLPFEKDGRTAYSLTDVLWMDKEPTKVEEAPKTPPSAKKQAPKSPAKASEITIGTGTMNIQLQQARKSTSIPDADYYAILEHEAGVTHGPDVKVVDFPKVFNAVSEYKLAIGDADVWPEGRE